MSCKSDSALSDGKHEQNLKVVVTILIANADNEVWRPTLRQSHGRPVSYSPTKHIIFYETAVPPGSSRPDPFSTFTRLKLFQNCVIILWNLSLIRTNADKEER